MSKYKLWTNVQNHPVAASFMSVLKLQNHRWSWTKNSAEATLWCVCAEGADLSRVEAYYDILSKKPPVAFLSYESLSMPYDEWVYFRVPLNVNVLHTWLTSKQLGSPNISDIAEDSRWYKDMFKLSYLPNVSNYVEDYSDMMLVCSHLLSGWSRYSELYKFGVQKSILDMMLSDAETEGNLVYNPEQSVESSSLNPKKIRKTTVFNGLFRRTAH